MTMTTLGPESRKLTEDFPELTNAWVLQTGFCWEVATQLKGLTPAQGSCTWEAGRLPELLFLVVLGFLKAGHLTRDPENA